MSHVCTARLGLGWGWVAGERTTTWFVHMCVWPGILDLVNSGQAFGSHRSREVPGDSSCIRECCELGDTDDAQTQTCALRFPSHTN